MMTVRRSTCQKAVTGLSKARISNIALRVQGAHAAPRPWHCGRGGRGRARTSGKGQAARWGLQRGSPKDGGSGCACSAPRVEGRMHCFYIALQAAQGGHSLAPALARRKVVILSYKAARPPFRQRGAEEDLTAAAKAVHGRIEGQGSGAPREGEAAGAKRTALLRATSAGAAPVAPHIQPWRCAARAIRGSRSRAGARRVGRQGRRWLGKGPGLEQSRALDGLDDQQRREADEREIACGSRKQARGGGVRGALPYVPQTPGAATAQASPLPWWSARSCPVHAARSPTLSGAQL
jgi:hypothetical protein